MFFYYIAVNNNGTAYNYLICYSTQQWKLGSTTPDLVIERVLMRSLKSNGGLTRGTDFKETKRATWILSMTISSTLI